MTQEQIRADFEEWAKDKAHLDSFEVDGEKRYAALTTNIMWESWQAAHAGYAPREKELEEGWEILPSDLRTHLADFKTAVVLLTGHHTHDYKGYWTHQFQVIERIEALIATKEPQ